jgi:hypothetical protein
VTEVFVALKMEKLFTLFYSNLEFLKYGKKKLSIEKGL